MDHYINVGDLFLAKNHQGWKICTLKGTSNSQFIPPTKKKITRLESALYLNRGNDISIFNHSILTNIILIKKNVFPVRKLTRSEGFTIDVEEYVIINEMKKVLEYLTESDINNALIEKDIIASKSSFIELEEFYPDGIYTNSYWDSDEYLKRGDIFSFINKKGVKKVGMLIYGGYDNSKKDSLQYLKYFLNGKRTLIKTVDAVSNVQILASYGEDIIYDLQKEKSSEEKYHKYRIIYKLIEDAERKSLSIKDMDEEEDEFNLNYEKVFNPPSHSKIKVKVLEITRVVDPGKIVFPDEKRLLMKEVIDGSYVNAYRRYRDLMYKLIGTLSPFTNQIEEYIYENILYRTITVKHSLIKKGLAVGYTFQDGIYWIKVLTVVKRNDKKESFEIEINLSEIIDADTEIISGLIAFSNSI